MSKDIKVIVAGITLAQGVVLVGKEQIKERGGAGVVLSEDHYESHSSGSISRKVSHDECHPVTRFARSRSSTDKVPTETYFKLARRRIS